MKKEIEILLADGCTIAEAKRFLDSNNVMIFESEEFKKYFKDYMEDLSIEKEDIVLYENMINKNEPVQDWSIVKYQGKTYYIAYSYVV